MRTISRRDFVKLGATGCGALALAAGGLGVAFAADAKKTVCMTIGNHWSYTGIGWQLGIESSVLSIVDAMEIVDKPPHLKTCINLDARAYEIMAEKFPEATDRLKRYLAEGKLELIGGSYGQPMGTMVGGESNIRQLVLGREAIRKSMGYEVATFLEEEEFSHPQVPQIAAGAGYRFVSLAQVDTWGQTGIPAVEHNVVKWQGIGRDRAPLHAEKRDDGPLGRNERNNRLAGLQETSGTGRAAGDRLGGVRLGRLGSSHLHPQRIRPLSGEVQTGLPSGLRSNA